MQKNGLMNEILNVMYSKIKFYEYGMIWNVMHFGLSKYKNMIGRYVEKCAKSSDMTKITCKRFIKNA